MSETAELRLPSVGEFVRSLGKLVEIQDVTPPPPSAVLDYIFETVEARVECRVNGKVVTTHSTFNEFYGEGLGIKAAIAEAQKLCKELSPSSLEFVVVKVTSRRRTRPARQYPECFYAKGVRDFQSLDYGSRRDLPDDIEEDVYAVSIPDKQR